MARPEHLRHPNKPVEAQEVADRSHDFQHNRDRLDDEIYFEVGLFLTDAGES